MRSLCWRSRISAGVSHFARLKNVPPVGGLLKNDPRAAEVVPPAHDDSTVCRHVTGGDKGVLAPDPLTVSQNLGQRSASPPEPLPKEGRAPPKERGVAGNRSLSASIAALAPHDDPLLLPPNPEKKLRLVSPRCEVVLLMLRGEGWGARGLRPDSMVELGVERGDGRIGDVWLWRYCARRRTHFETTVSLARCRHFRDRREKHGADKIGKMKCGFFLLFFISCPVMTLCRLELGAPQAIETIPWCPTPQLVQLYQYQRLGVY